MSSPTGWTAAARATELPVAGRWRLRPDPRMPAYLVGGLGALLAAIVTGRHELASLAAPFLLLAARGLAGRERGAPRGQVRVRGARAMEGDRIVGDVRLAWEGEAEVDVLLAGWPGLTPVEPAPVVGWSLPRGSGPVTLPFVLRARSWGRHELGPLWVRVRRPGSFAVREHLVAPPADLRVLPGALRLGRLLHPPEPRAAAGVHLSRHRGHGTDFAELRPYQPGDRLRDVSWATSARLGAPWVAVRHPERTGTVLLLLDAVSSRHPRSTEALARAARAAWAVASAHLRAQDRVGLLAMGRTAAWLPPRGGRRARWMLLDELLAVGRALESRTRRREPRGRMVVPGGALVVGVTSLRSQTFVPELLGYRRRAHACVALVIDTSDLLPPAPDRTEAAARRIWLAQRDAERDALEWGGVPTALVTATDGVGPAVLALRRRLAAARNPLRREIGTR